MLARFLKRKRKSKISQNLLLKALNLTRALRKMYRRLHAENHISKETAVLVHAGKKFIVKNKIFRKENKGLRDIIFKEKRKRKCKKNLISIKRVNRKGRPYFLILYKLRGRASA